MKKILSLVAISICILTSGCVSSNTSVIINKNDSAVIENKILINKSVLTMGNISVEEFFTGKHDDNLSKYYVEQNNNQLKTEKIKIEENDFVGYKYITTVDKLRNTDISPVLRILQPKNKQILLVDDRFFNRKYKIDAVVRVEEGRKYVDEFLNAKFSIKIPTKPTRHNADTITENNELFWDISPTSNKQNHPIQLEFTVIKWNCIILTSILTLLILAVTILAFLKANSLNAIKENFNKIIIKKDELFAKPQKTKEENSEKKPESNKDKLRSKNPKRRIIILSSVSFLVIGLILFLSVPRFNEYLITKNLENIYLGHNIEKSATTLKFLLKHSKNKEQYGIDIISKSIGCLNNDDIKTSLLLANIAIKLDRQTVEKQKAKFENKLKQLTTEQKYEEALNICLLLEEIDKDNEKVYFQRGLIYEKLGNTKTAIENYSKAIKLKNTYVDAYKQRGNLYFIKQKDYCKAYRDMKNIVTYSLNKNDLAYAHYVLAKIYIDQKDYKKAMDESYLSKELYYSLGILAKANESDKLFWHAADLECNRPGGYCY